MKYFPLLLLTVAFNCFGELSYLSEDIFSQDNVSHDSCATCVDRSLDNETMHSIDRDLQEATVVRDENFLELVTLIKAVWREANYCPEEEFDLLFDKTSKNVPFTILSRALETCIEIVQNNNLSMEQIGASSSNTATPLLSKLNNPEFLELFRSIKRNLEEDYEKLTEHAQTEDSMIMPESNLELLDSSCDCE